MILICMYIWYCKKLKCFFLLYICKLGGGGGLKKLYFLKNILDNVIIDVNFLFMIIVLNFEIKKILFKKKEF